MTETETALRHAFDMLAEALARCDKRLAEIDRRLAELEPRERKVAA